MTAQMNDTFIYQEHSYSLVGMTAEIPFHPMMFGIHPVGTCTACWAGFVVTYKLIDDQFCVHYLKTNDDHKEQADYVAPKVFGVTTKPKPDFKGKGIFARFSQWGFFDLIYENIDHLVKYTGSVMLGKDFVTGLYAHMGYHPAWKYAQVHELTFDKGILTEARDISKEMAEQRAAYMNQMNEQDLDAPTKLPNSLDEFRQNIEKAFDRKYRKKG